MKSHDLRLAGLTVFVACVSLLASACAADDDAPQPRPTGPSLSELTDTALARPARLLDDGDACLSVRGGDAIDAGVTEIGTSLVTTVTVESCGASALTLSGLAADAGSPFALDPSQLPLTVAPGATATLDLVYSPVADEGTVELAGLLFDEVSEPASVLLYGATPGSGVARDTPPNPTELDGTDGVPVVGCLHADVVALDGVAAQSDLFMELGDASSTRRLLMFHNCGESVMPVLGVYSMFDQPWLRTTASRVPGELAPGERALVLAECELDAVQDEGVASLLVPLHAYDNGGVFGMGLGARCVRSGEF